MILFSQKFKLVKLFEKFCEENNLLNCPVNVMVWLWGLGLLNEEKAKEYLKENKDEKELTPLEHLEFIGNYEIDDEHRTLNMKYACKQSLDIIESALKALEIVKEKSVDVGFLQYSSTADLYNHYIVEHAWTKHTKILTQEEYDLLKEVL